MPDDPKVTTDHLPRYSVRSWGLLHYHLTHLDDDLPEIRPDYLELKRTHAFISDSLESFKKEEARSDAADLFAFIERLHPDVEWEPTQNGTPDAVYGSLTGLPCGILRLKNEVGLDGDASTQARVSYVMHVSEDKQEVRTRYSYSPVASSSHKRMCRSSIYAKSRTVRRS